MAKDKLFRLISSLNSGEKRYLSNEFKHFHSRKAENYQKIYKLYVRHLEEGAEGVGDALVKAGFPDHLSVLKSQCFNWILTRLRIMHSNNSIETRIRNLVHESEILFKKGMYKATRRRIRQAMTLIEEHEKYELHAGVFRMLVNLELTSSELPAHQSAEQIHSFQSQFQHAQSRVNSIGLLWSLSHQITLVQHLPGALVELEQLSEHPLLREEPKDISVEGRIFWHHCRGTISARRDEFVDAEKHFGKMVELYQAHPNFIEENEDNYFITLQNYCQVALQIKLEKAVEKTLKELEQIIVKIRPSSNPSRIVVSRILCYFGNLFAWYDEFGLREGLREQIKKFDAWCSLIKPGQFRQLDPSLVQIYLTIALLLFRERAYRDAFSWLEMLLDKKEAYIDNRTKMQSQLLAILFLYHQSELEAMERRTRSFRRSYPKVMDEEPFFHFVLVVLDEINKALPLDLPKVLAKARERYAKANAAGIFGKAFFDFPKWLDAVVA